MKKILILIAILFTSNIVLQAQDLIVTKKGDSINCKITKLKKESIHFIFKHKKSNEIRNTLLALNDVTKYQYNFYKTKEISDNYKSTGSTESKFQFDIYGGYSYRTSKIEEGQEDFLIDYIKGLKSGYHFGIDATYFMSESMGFGLKFNKSMASNHLNNVYVYNEDTEIIGEGFIEDNISLTFLGVTYVSKLVHGEKENAFYYGLGLGYLGYYNKKEIVIESIKLKGSTFGTSFDVGYNFSISPKLALGLRFSAIGGRLFRVTTEYSNGTTEVFKYPDNNYESLYRIDLSIGLVYNL